MLRVVFLCFVALGACSKTDIQTGNLVNIRTLGDIPFTLLGKVKATVDTVRQRPSHAARMAPKASSWSGSLTSLRVSTRRKSILVGTR